MFKGQSHQNKIAVGDEVEIDLKAAEDAGWILRMLPRRTKLSRRSGMGEPEHVLVSNADTLLIVASLRNPPFRGGLVDRFLVAGSCGGLEPVLILSKADLVTSAEITPIKNLYSSGLTSGSSARIPGVSTMNPPCGSRNISAMIVV